MELKKGLTGTGRRLASAVGHVSNAGGFAAGVLICITVLIMNYEVLMRYLFTKPTTWVFETSHYLLAAIFTWGLAYGLNEGAHIAIDVLKNRLHPRTVAWINAAISSLIVVTLTVALWIMYGMISDTIARRDTSPTLLAVPLQWPRIAIAVGFLLFACQAVVRCWRTWQTASAKGEP